MLGCHYVRESQSDKVSQKQIYYTWDVSESCSRHTLGIRHLFRSEQDTMLLLLLLIWWQHIWLLTEKQDVRHMNLSQVQAHRSEWSGSPPSSQLGAVVPHQLPSLSLPKVGPCPRWVEHAQYVLKFNAQTRIDDIFTTVLKWFWVSAQSEYLNASALLWQRWFVP